LSLTLFAAVVIVVLAQIGELGPDHEGLDLDLAFLLFVAALDDHARAPAPVGIFWLRPPSARPRIELRPQPCLPPEPHHPLVIVHAITVEDGHHHGTGLWPRLDLAEMRKRGGEARYPDGKAGRRHRLAAEAGHEPIVASAAADRAETHRPAVVILRF